MCQPARGVAKNGQLTNKSGETHLTSQGKERLRKLIRWLLVDLAVAAFVLAVLFYRPSQYNPTVNEPSVENRRKVPRYISHELLPAFYNDAQTGKPFDLVVDQDKMNETIALQKWPQESQGITFSSPVLLFVPGQAQGRRSGQETGRIIFMGTASIEGADFVVTIEIEPTIDEQGLLDLEVVKVKIGAMNITPLARIVARQMYEKRLETVPVDTERILAKIAAALLADEPFEPVFEAHDKLVRIEKIMVEQGRLTARIVPAPERARARPSRISSQ